MVHFIKIWLPLRTTTRTIDRIFHMQVEPKGLDITSWTGDETTIVPVPNEQLMLAVWAGILLMVKSK